MPNQITALGITTKTRAELVAEFTANFEAIYGPDINLDQDSPDGQMMQIYIQACIDLQDLVTQVYNSFDPDNAIGRVLDQRVAINGIQRQGGTYSETPVTIVMSQAATLQGLDTFPDAPYTVKDGAGNEWQLKNTQNPTAGTFVYTFRAKVPGAVISAINTITSPVVVVLGVTSINNPTTYSELGVTEESDALLRVRRQKSVALSTQGYLDGLVAALKNVTGVEDAFVYENVTGATDADLIPSHSIWVIVSGTGANADIADAIYRKRNAGAGMKGDEVEVITQLDGSPISIKWDVVVDEDLFIAFTATSLDGVNLPDEAGIRAQLPSLFVPAIAAEVNINQLATLVQQIDPNTLVTVTTPNEGLSYSSGAGTYANSLETSAKNKQFKVLGTAPRLVITVTPL